MFVLVSLPDHRFACSGSVMSAPGIGVFSFAVSCPQPFAVGGWGFNLRLGGLVRRGG